MARFDYIEARTPHEAIGLLADAGPQARLIAGGTDVLMDIRRAKIAPSVLVGIAEIPELQGVRALGDGVWVGAATTHHAVTVSPLIQARFPILASASGRVGSRQIRNVATIGGNICNAVPCADTAPTLLALGAVARVLSAAGERDILLTDFFAGPGRSVLAAGDLLLGFSLPSTFSSAAGAYHKHAWREALDIQMCGAAVVLKFEPGGARCTDARVALGTSGPTPMRAARAESALIGTVVSEQVAAEIGRLAASEARPRDSYRASGAYRREMIEVLVRRGIMDALSSRKENAR